MKIDFSRDDSDLTQLQVILNEIKIGFVQAALNVLTETERNAVTARYYFRMDAGQVAEYLDMSGAQTAQEILTGTQKFRAAYVAQYQDQLSAETRNHVPLAREEQLQNLFQLWGDSAISPQQTVRMRERLMTAIAIRELGAHEA